MERHWLNDLRAWYDSSSLDGDRRFPMRKIESQLGAGEQVLWRGEPRKGLLLRPYDAYMIPFSLFWAGFAVYWEASVIKEKWGFGELWGIPFVALGAYITVGRFFYDTYKRSKTQYAVTNQRILILCDGIRPETRSLDLRSLGEISLSLGHGDFGTISFGAPLPGANSWAAANDYRPKFEMIERTHAVHDLILDARRKAQGSSDGEAAQRWGV
jgi:hypothetical protein